MNKKTIILIIIVAIIAAAIIGFMAMFLWLLCNNEVAIANFINIEQMGLLEAGLAIITLAVTIWGTLGIINYLNKDDIKEATNAAKAATKKIEGIRNDVTQSHRDVEELSKNLTTVKTKTEKELFLYELGSRDNASAGYFLKQFQNSIENDIPSGYAGIFIELIKIERLHKQIGELHSNGDKSNPVLLGKAKELRQCKENIEQLLPDADSELTKTVRYYLKVRESYSYFFSGYAYDKAADHDAARREFRTAAEKYQEIMDEIFPMFKSHCGEFRRKACFETGKFDDSYCKRNCDEMLKKLHYDAIQYRFILGAVNTIGESYSKILYRNQLELESSGEQGKQKSLDWEEDWKKALFYFTITRYIAEKMCITTETYYRNFGCAYERSGRLLWLQSDAADTQSRKEVLEQYKIALSYYVQAFNTEFDSDARNGKMKSIYRVLLSGYDRVIRLELGLDPIPDKEERFNPQVKASLVPSRPDWREITDHIQEFIEYAEIAADRIPSQKLHHTMRGMANLWALLVMTNCNCGLTNIDTDKQKLLNAIKESMAAARRHGATEDDNYYYSITQGLKLID